jgi:hypothetical protein
LPEMDAVTASRATLLCWTTNMKTKTNTPARTGYPNYNLVNFQQYIAEPFGETSLATRSTTVHGRLYQQEWVWTIQNGVCTTVCLNGRLVRLNTV